MRQYETLLKHVRDNETKKSKPTGTGTLSVFGYQMRFNLNVGFPLITTKRVRLKSIIHELIWFLKGNTNINDLQESMVTISDEWTNKNALLAMMVAQVCGLGLGEFIHTSGYTHIYLNYLDQVNIQISRLPRPRPKIQSNSTIKNNFDFKYEDFKLKRYNPYLGIKTLIAI